MQKLSPPEAEIRESELHRNLMYHFLQTTRFHLDLYPVLNELIWECVHFPIQLLSTSFLPA